ncbi:MAG TPA: AbrB/MazE/SpoVT family DNA-binding domain-containing protein [Sulfuricella sp.]|nr:AbrB/MazE/SpoVT family DNA-binding domain-containing protein [Sulfuricella sp.]
MTSATLSSKFQIVIPKALREQLHLEAGQQFVFVTKGNIINLVPKQDLKQLRGLLKGANSEDVRDHQDRP